MMKTSSALKILVCRNSVVVVTGGAKLSIIVSHTFFDGKIECEISATATVGDNFGRKSHGRGDGGGSSGH